MKVEIKEPCHEDWDKMKIGLHSRFCDSCEKDVQDFTKMSRGEIITYMLSKPNESVCGRMRKDQFDFQHKDIPVLIESLRKQRPSNSFMILALVCLSLASCNDEHTMGEIEVPSPINKDKIEVVDKKDKDSVMHHDTTATGEIEIPAPGMISVEPHPEPPMPVGMIEMGEPIVMPPEPPIHAPLPEPPEVGGGTHPDPTDDPLSFAEKMPEYPGGIEAMMKFIKDNLEYPRFEKETGIEGNVYVRFVVERDGSLTSPEVLKSVSGSKNFDKEVIRVVNKMPNWIPGENMGKISRVYMTIPFRFKLSD